jgi:hypothetical protein
MLSALVLSALAIVTQPNPASAGGGPVKLDRAPTSAEWDAGEVACFIQVIGQNKDLEFQTTQPECWLVAAGDRREPWAAARTSGASTSSFTNVGYHFDGFNYSGSYITIAGTVCNGGWLDLSWDWINRISSTDSPCWVGHYDGYGLTGGSEYLSSGNLSWQNNATNSLQYV